MSAHRHSAATLAVLAILALGASLGAATGPAAGAILGTWLTEPGEKGGRAHVEISERGGEYRGRIVWLEEPEFPPGDPMAGEPKVDLENPDPALRDRPILGLTILRGFRYEEGEWVGGTVYDPANGKTYKAQMRLEGGDTLALRGYIGIPLIGRTSTWKRVAPAD